MDYKTEGLNELSKQINEFVCNIGFENGDVPLRISLIHSEVSEAFEAFRKDKYAELDKFKSAIKDVNDDTYKDIFHLYMKDTFEDEIADSIIRLLDLCSRNNIDIEEHIKHKMYYNSLRGYKFGNKKF